MTNPFKQVGSFFIDKGKDVTQVVQAADTLLRSIPLLINTSKITVEAIQLLATRLQETQDNLAKLHAALDDLVGKEKH